MTSRICCNCGGSGREPDVGPIPEYKGVHLTRFEGQILAELLAHPDRRVSISHITTALWGNSREPQNPSESVRVIVHRLRYKLEPVGVFISQNYDGFGWRILPGPPAHLQDDPEIRQAVFTLTEAGYGRRRVANVLRITEHVVSCILDRPRGTVKRAARPAVHAEAAQ